MDLCNEEYIVSIWSSSAITFIAVINLDGWPLDEKYILILLYIGAFSINDHVSKQHLMLVNYEDKQQQAKFKLIVIK